MEDGLEGKIIEHCRFTINHRLYFFLRKKG